MTPALIREYPRDRVREVRGQLSPLVLAGELPESHLIFGELTRVTVARLSLGEIVLDTSASSASGLALPGQAPP
jgi:hypothetical protein